MENFPGGQKSVEEKLTTLNVMGQSKFNCGSEILMQYSFEEDYGSR